MLPLAATVALLCIIYPGIVHVGDYGAVGDGATDDTAAFQAALDAAAQVGATVVAGPVGPGRGYVLTTTVTLAPGVSLVGSMAGMPFFAWEGVPRAEQRGPVILARPRLDDRSPGARRPLFHLRGGNTVRGLYILYDQEPWPSDDDFADPDSPYHYSTDEDVTERFIADHVTPCGPTILVQPGVASVTVEDVTCGRYTDFLYAPAGGKIVVDKCYLFGYGRAFAIREARDTIRISRIHIVPNVEGPISWEHSKLHAAITAHRGSIAFDFGSVDGYSVSDVVVFLAHTGVKLGASEEEPFVDPITGERVAFRWGLGPWGSIDNVKLDNCAVGLDCVLGTILPNQVTNLMVHSSIRPRERFPAVNGNLARQAAVLVRPGFAGATLQMTNVSLSSFAPTNVVATGSMIEQSGGRAFLVDCPAGQGSVDYAQRDQAHITVFGLVVSNIPETHLVGLTEGTRPDIRVCGFVHNGVARPDGPLL